MMVNEANIRRFVTNLFVYPAGYFEQHTPRNCASLRRSVRN